jgi:SAM-dependent methyltransferase
MTPTEWLWLNTYGQASFPSLRGYLPAMPPEDIQVRFTGASGPATLGEAFRFYRMVTEAAAGTRPRMAMDFGCGWGRITRFFIRDFDKESLIGVDPLPLAVDICRDTNPWATFTNIGLAPPVDLPDSSLDLVFAFSVFSHLTEKTHLSWLSEFARLLRPGGVLVVTTRKRSFITDCARIRAEEERSPVNTGAFVAFTDTAAALARYDAGEYCNDPVGGGDGLPEETYGETCIPLAYARRRWTPEFSVVDFIDDPRRLNQNVIVARRT